MMLFGKDVNCFLSHIFRLNLHSGKNRAPLAMGFLLSEEPGSWNTLYAHVTICKQIITGLCANLHLSQNLCIGKNFRRSLLLRTFQNTDDLWLASLLVGWWIIGCSFVRRPCSESMSAAQKSCAANFCRRKQFCLYKLNFEDIKIIRFEQSEGKARGQCSNLIILKYPRSLMDLKQCLICGCECLTKSSQINPRLEQ